MCGPATGRSAVRTPSGPRRGKIGAGSYEDPVEERERRRRPKKTGRPGR